MPADRSLHDPLLSVPAGDTGAEADGSGAGGCGGVQAGGDVYSENQKRHVSINESIISCDSYAVIDKPNLLALYRFRYLS